MRKPRLQIIRGLPGSGKTTLALTKYPFLMRLETDMFFYREGAYRFTMENNKKAVKWFLKQIDNYCNQGFDFVTTGVFSAHTERLSKAVDTALKKGYEVYISTQTSEYKGVHGVPEDHLKAMRDSFLSAKELRMIYKGRKNVHFGLMTSLYPLAHMKGKDK